MPHYLRMLTYAIEPETEWGPAKNENRYGRYIPKMKSSKDIHKLNNTEDESNLDVHPQNIFRIRL
jgi:hypothetical protein